MRVKIADLKTHLSKYIQGIRKGGEPIEVCVRDQTVAYLTSAEQETPDQTAQARVLAQRLGESGLILTKIGRVSRRSVKPAEAGDRRKPRNTVVAMRAEKGW